MMGHISLRDCPEDILVQIFTYYQSDLPYLMPKRTSQNLARMHALLVLNKQLYPIIQRVMYASQFPALSKICSY